MIYFANYEIQLKIDASQSGEFYLKIEGKKLAEMTFRIIKNVITIYHTEVDASLQGTGVAQNLLYKMEKYVRENNLKVIPLCPYVSIQFRCKPERYRAFSPRQSKFVMKRDIGCKYDFKG